MAAVSLAGKKILITGAGSGIGRATAVKLHKLGATLALTDIDGRATDQTRELCGDAGGVESHYGGVMDVADERDVASRVKDIVGRFDHLDHVFNCAGVNPTAMPLVDTPSAYFDKLVGVNLKGVYNVTRATIPHMKTPGSTYVNVSSILGWNARAQMSIYCATKFGLIGFSKSMALELGPKGIRTNVIAPGNVETPTNEGIMRGTAEAREEMEKSNALGRIGTPEDIADVVAFLMSEEAQFMNGSVVEVDGMPK
ncbi:3-oxoacyl-reductase [Microdochium trichocladiopsis]|uniref:3-oxoacyl-reductase n=1 Tax=Microdochium trichocladiopsis TaxID=1682393 RepID=A0A9P9BUF6_9PEZI|nr:3-oxoacyl-reductase [Microdochium trichocladiopsis]KAH7037424.1 3-oxoacyl-reductase [Microdochium trichocladiopsis]